MKSLKGILKLSSDFLLEVLGKALFLLKCILQLFLFFDSGRLAVLLVGDVLKQNMPVHILLSLFCIRLRLMAASFFV